MSKNNLIFTVNFVRFEMHYFIIESSSVQCYKADQFVMHIILHFRHEYNINKFSFHYILRIFFIQHVNKKHLIIISIHRKINHWNTFWTFLALGTL